MEEINNEIQEQLTEQMTRSPAKDGHDGHAEKPSNEEEDGHGDKDDVYSYCHRDTESCENFKIEIKNMPKYVSYKDVQKFLVKHASIKPHKIKIVGNQFKLAFVAFKSEQEREQVISKLNGLIWKKNHLTVKKALPAADPLIMKRKLENYTNDNKKVKGDIEASLDHINDKVCPLWKIDYQEQLKRKYENVKVFLSMLSTDIDATISQPNSDLAVYLSNIKSKFDGIHCKLDQIRASPDVEGYRNKCEFSIGIDKTVGFRMGLYKEGSVSVIPIPVDCPIVNRKMLITTQLFQKYLQTKSKLEPYNQEMQSGYWRQLTVRTTRTGDTMITAYIYPQELTENEIAEEKGHLKDFILSEAKDNEELKISSIFFQVYKKGLQTEKVSHVYGDSFVRESMMSDAFHFKISPDAFFQINTSAAEICYQVIEELAGLTKDTILLDICCGTGTIGIYLASKVKYVYGIEMNKSAISDAQENAKTNNTTNIEFLCGKAEDLINKTINKIQSNDSSELDSVNLDIVAVIDPPRAGLNNSIVKILRATASIKRLIYVSCEPKFAKRNLIDLVRPKSKAYNGEPFVPVEAVPIDMFPHTDKYELVMLYERLNI